MVGGAKTRYETAYVAATIVATAATAIVVGATAAPVPHSGTQTSFLQQYCNKLKLTIDVVRHMFVRLGERSTVTVAATAAA